MKLLIIGGSGFLGGALLRQAPAAGFAAAATYSTRPPDTAGDIAWYRLDVRDPAQVTGVLDQVAPSVVVNTSSGGADWAVTAEGAVRVAMAAAARGCRLVHVSSDAVFSGDRGGYDETCLPDPVTPYGAAKAAAETGVRLVAPHAVVARTSLILGDGRALSVHERHVHDLVAGTRDGVLFTDVVRCPVQVADLAAALLELAASDEAGVRHIAGPDALTRHELGVLIAGRDGLDASRLPAGRLGGTSLRGALDVRLDGRATRRGLRTRLRGAREFLAERRG
ncbi:sugar nucleotide-binding protein [Streptomyces europaeiscabiei]|uniref:sugar nucleotide-binding protein n=1 Tax=Streptomyces europaeiscabiei TaxID=146819 RepID=UPI0029ABB278|nr:sugar nucleotide-binding protein [Streptomyces europaeiscabiei]MDX3696654.1 sugar nucleotide-binding protein [Streptomyces europaeiscabiei]